MTAEVVQQPRRAAHRDRRLVCQRARRALVSVLLVCMAVHAHAARAWSASAHRMIASMAEVRLSPRTRVEVRALLQPSGATSLADVAAWADEVREDPARAELAKATAKLHYVNFADSTCHYDAARDCANGDCVVAAIPRYAARLADRTLDRSERAQALRFLVHFVGDVHQPLHAGYRSDRGGNTFQVQLAGKGTNLHSVWDYDVVASRKLGWRKYSLALQPVPRAAAVGEPRDWAEVSCRLSRDAGIYPRGHKLGERYLETMRPVAEQRLQRAAIELAAMLEHALARQ